MKIGVLDLLEHKANTWWEYADRLLVKRQFANLMPQAVSVWCRRMGHRVHYATYYGIGDPKAKLPRDLDLVFVSAHTALAPLAYALSKAYRMEGVRTVIGGPHAKCFPEHCLRHFDVVVLQCDEALVADITNGEFQPGSIISSEKAFDDMPTIEERLPEIRASAFLRGRPYPGNFIPMLASIGCPYNCDFCVDWNSRYRALSLDRLAEDLRYAAKHLPGVPLGFHDPNFGVRFDEVMAALETVPPGQRNPYVFESSLSNLRLDRLERLRDTNCVAVIVGVESWCQYSKKAGAHDATAEEKLDRVVEHFQALRERVHYLQASFILGIDTDEGDEPFELTGEFVRRAPFATPIVNIPVAFGGTPLHHRLLREGRLRSTLPFTFHHKGHLTIVLKNYDPITYYRRKVDLHAVATSGSVLKARLAASRHWIARAVHRVNASNHRYWLGAFRATLDRLQADPGFLAFHRGETDTLPSFYANEHRRLLGKYAELVPIEECQPDLDGRAPMPEAAGSARSERTEGSLPSLQRLRSSEMAAGRDESRPYSQ